MGGFPNLWPQGERSSEGIPGALELASQAVEHAQRSVQVRIPRLLQRGTHPQMRLLDRQS